jgi:NADPH:quinone reductase-like Zn-dependent oxidoreductase
MLGFPVRIYNGIKKPARIRILGQELAGEIESVGKDVTSFRPGDRVYGTTGFSMGAYAQYICLPELSDEAVLTAMPKNLSYEEAAGVPTGGLESIHFLRKAGIEPGEHVLINGAGGSIGTIGVQLAKYWGAKVTAVDTSEKHEMLRSIGADETIDFTREDYTRTGRNYDVIFDVIGKSPYARSVKALREGGRYLLANPRLSQMIRKGFTYRLTGKKVIAGASASSKEDLVFLTDLIESGSVKPVVDRVFPLEQTADAHRYVETGKKAGNVVIAI